MKKINKELCTGIFWMFLASAVLSKMALITNNDIKDIIIVLLCQVLLIISVYKLYNAKENRK